MAGAETYLARQAAQPFGTAYPGNDDGVYEWGSNTAVLNNQVVLGTAFDLTSDQRYRRRRAGVDGLPARPQRPQQLVHHRLRATCSPRTSTAAGSPTQLSESLPNPPRGSVSGGPNSDVGTWDPVIGGLYGADHMCAPQACYVDDIQSWSTNEITVNWNSAMSWVASFVADQQDGDRSAAGTVAWIVTEPADVTAVDGAQVTFTVSASGSPAPSVQWQEAVGGVWTDIPDATGATYTLTARTAPTGTARMARAAGPGLQYRAYVANRFGGVYTDPATLTVTAAAAPTATVAPTGPAPTASPSTATPATGTGTLATTGAEAAGILVAALVLLLAGAGAVLLARRARVHG